jgi:hypothetical protein
LKEKHNDLSMVGGGEDGGPPDNKYNLPDNKYNLPDNKLSKDVETDTGKKLAGSEMHQG